MFPKFKLRKKQQDTVSEARLSELIRQELDGYIKRDDIQEYLAKIKRDEQRRKLWDSLSPRRKLKLLRYVVSKRSEQSEKK